MARMEQLITDWMAYVREGAEAKKRATCRELEKQLDGVQRAVEEHEGLVSLRDECAELEARVRGLEADRDQQRKRLQERRSQLAERLMEESEKALEAARRVEFIRDSETCMDFFSEKLGRNLSELTPSQLRNSGDLAGAVGEVREEVTVWVSHVANTVADLANTRAELERFEDEKRSLEAEIEKISRELAHDHGVGREQIAACMSSKDVGALAQIRKKLQSHTDWADTESQWNLPRKAIG